MATTRLVLMRHAKSDWGSGEHDDHLRPLNDRGVRDARAMGRWFARTGHLPATILSSSSRRTRDTLRLLAEGAGVALEARTVWSDALYLASSETIRAALAAHGEASDVMVLGHNPGMEELLAWLLPPAADIAEQAKVFPTGAVYVLESSAPLTQLERGCARIVAHQRPRSLSD